MKVTPAKSQSSRLLGFSDSVLCEECLNGNEEAWSALLERYQKVIYSIPLKFHFSPEEAADIFQAVALDLFTGLETLRSRDKVQGWLIAVARHRCIRHKQKRTTENHRLREIEEIATLPDPSLRVDEVIRQVEEESQVREAVAELSPRCRDLVEWFFYSDPPPSYDEVAKRLGVVRNSVGFIRDHCLNKLQRALEKKGFAGKPRE